MLFLLGLLDSPELGPRLPLLVELPLLLLSDGVLRLLLIVPLGQCGHLLVLEEPPVVILIGIWEVVPRRLLFLLPTFFCQAVEPLVQVVESPLNFCQRLVPEDTLLILEPPLEKVELLFLTKLQIFLP